MLGRLAIQVTSTVTCSCTTFGPQWQPAGQSKHDKARPDMEQAVIVCLSRPRRTRSVERTCWEKTASPQSAKVHGTGLGHVHNELNQIVQRAVGALDGSTCAQHFARRLWTQGQNQFFCRWRKQPDTRSRDVCMYLSLLPQDVTQAQGVAESRRATAESRLAMTPSEEGYSHAPVVKSWSTVALGASGADSGWPASMRRPLALLKVPKAGVMGAHGVVSARS